MPTNFGTRGADAPDRPYTLEAYGPGGRLHYELDSPPDLDALQAFLERVNEGALGPVEPYDYAAAVAAMLTLRVNTPPGEWLNDADVKIYQEVFAEAEAADGVEDADEYLFLAMMNAAWLAIQHLAVLTGETEQVWLERVVADLRGPDA